MSVVRCRLSGKFYLKSVVNFSRQVFRASAVNTLHFIQGKFLSENFQSSNSKLQTPDYFCSMNEPAHSHFVLADAQYCHSLEDRFYIGKRELPEKLPAPVNKLDYVTLSLQIAGLAVLLFFTVMTLITQYYVVTFTLGLLSITLALALIRSAGFTATKTILKVDVLGVDYHKKMFGYDYFIIRYAGPGGKVWKRRLAIYDSQQCLDQALKAMKDAGFMK